MQIGPYKLPSPVIAAPMAGVTDKPYRRVCREHGAALVVSEMVTSRVDLRQSTKTRFRSDLAGEPEPVVVQIVGTDPAMLAAAAQYNVQNGAQIIDINMGCPAKKVCKKAAGSALLENEPLVEKILRATVAAVDVPVTLKIRTGSDPQNRNGPTIARIAEDSGVQSLTVHGRTRRCKFVGAVEYDTIAEIKQAISIPVVANGDIDSPQAARDVLNYTAADAVMIGRAAQGRPWLFGQIAAFLANGELVAMPDRATHQATILNHIAAIHDFYGASLGVRLARKHIKWYLQHWPEPICDPTRAAINQTEQCQLQHQLLSEFLSHTGAARTALAA
ncbi:MAG: tRNA dihydrouridine synthase DusB [Gammaproteobacteria bacterium]|nr:tRNA dihydrouridine synthase DusB [Gammaproteobacteria bacterium]